MKGYYTVRAESPSCSQSQRMTLEAGYARELEAILGGADRTTELCLVAASERADGAARASLLRASEAAAAAVRVVLQVPDDCRFSIDAWQATDL
ncbi:MAG: hypothetical protein JWQ07_4813 [Ramlibacter sp.]|nr:hypothetical protein [Ramlibacter sp.]